jgi:epoxyqueuosine reductase QueG
MARRQNERLDPTVVLDGARTVIALAIAYHRPAGESGPIARYARLAATITTRTATG